MSGKKHTATELVHVLAVEKKRKSRTLACVGTVMILKDLIENTVAERITENLQARKRENTRRRQSTQNTTPSSKTRQPIPCVKCQTPSVIRTCGMCGKCWQREYAQRPGFKEKQKVWTQRFGQKQKEKRQRDSIRECTKCHITTEICRREMCKNCYENDVKERKRLSNERWLQGPAVKKRMKLHAQRYGQLPENKKRHAAWLRRYRFFRTGKPVGPFDPNKIMAERLLKTVDEVRKGDFSRPSRRSSRYEILLE